MFIKDGTLNKRLDIFALNQPEERSGTEKRIENSRLKLKAVKKIPPTINSNKQVQIEKFKKSVGYCPQELDGMPKTTLWRTWVVSSIHKSLSQLKSFHHS